MKRGVVLTILSLLLGSAVAFGQSAHFSQYFHNPVLLNPAYSPLDNFEWHVTVQYRRQWAAIAKPFVTSALTFQKTGNHMDFGGAFENNKVDQSGFTILNVAPFINYHKFIGSGHRHFITLGIQPGIMQKSIDLSAMSFDSQYTTGAGYDPTLPTGENINTVSISNFNLNLGVYYAWVNNESTINPYFGFSIKHFNRPDESIGLSSTTGEKIIVQRNHIFIGGANISIPGNKVILNPSLLIMSQKSLQEFMLGLNANYSLNDNTTFLGGLHYRSKDALSVNIATCWNNWVMGISYDMNVSSLKEASGGKGGWEITLSRSFGKRKKYKREKRKTNPQTKDQDKDKDGIVDQEDKCPDTFGKAEFNGCPPTDTDNDGVFDDKDACPSIPGVRFNEGCPVTKDDIDGDGVLDAQDICVKIPGPEDNKGCPIANDDADGDGIANHEDKCPMLHGHRQLEGCPDTDKDGIMDLEDVCPTVPGKIAYRGCPSEEDKPKDDGNTPQIALEFGNMEFDINSSVIPPKYFMMLDDLANFLRQHTDRKLLISGHTDSDGNSNYNFELGESRSNAVRKYLMLKGVKFHIIESSTYGETLPVRENTSTYGKARNRRVELLIIAL